ncbi:MAG: T9SS type A sorting domain-containing protein [Bacteroidota bacterium]
MLCNTIMMRTGLFLSLFCLLAFSLSAQNFPIGYQTMNFTDPERSNRPVPAEVYYPGLTAGSNAPLADGKFPVISFGHGFLMAYDSYLYLKDSLVPLGYIIAFAKTETGILPDHLEYGKDLAFLVNQMQSEGNTPSSAYYNHIDSTSAIMGHSMGGGASFLGCENNPVPNAMITFAAAETSPSAITAARHIYIPSLVFSADKDCVTPPATNQVPMYDSLASDCKVLINIKGGGHCYFADYNFICSAGEFGCSSSFTITRDQQHDAVIDFLVPYLDYYLKKAPLGWTIFNDSLQYSQRITYMESCSTTGIPDPGRLDRFVISPNPVHDKLIVTPGIGQERVTTIVLRSLTGSVVLTRLVKDETGTAATQVDLSYCNAGAYFLEITGRSGMVLVFRLIKL